MSRPSSLDYGLLLIIGVLWGSQFALNDIAIASFGPLTVGAARLLLGAITLDIILRTVPGAGTGARGEGPPARQPWRLYTLIAVVEGIVPLVFIPWGQRTVDSAIAAIILALVPIFTLALAPLILRGERWTKAAVLSVALGFVGVVVLLAPSIGGGISSSGFGEMLILFAAASWAVGILLLKMIPQTSPFRVMRNIFGIAALLATPLALAIERPWSDTVTLESAAALLGLGVFCGGIAYGLFLYSVMRAGPTFTALVGYLVTLFGVIFGVAFMGDRFAGHDILAILLIAAALGCARLKGRSANAAR